LRLAGTAVAQSPPTATSSDVADRAASATTVESSTEDAGYAVRAAFELTVPREADVPVLASHGYGESPRVWGGRIDVVAMLVRYVGIGGRVGVRGRSWDHLDALDAHATGADALLLVEARLPLGRIVDIVAGVGGGIGMGSLALNEAGSLGFSPRFDAALALGFTIRRPVRIRVEGGFSHFSIADQLAGDSLDLGGPRGAVGIEVRP
jgi:hypothetical protein